MYNPDLCLVIRNRIPRLYSAVGARDTAVAGIQQALGEGARYATLCLTPSSMGCTTPTAAAVKDKIEDSVYGIGPGEFQTPLPTLQTSGTSKYYDLEVTYRQATNLLLLPGPTVSVRRTKRVWVAGS